MFDFNIYWVEFLDSKGTQQDEIIYAHSDAEACRVVASNRKVGEFVLHVWLCR